MVRDGQVVVRPVLDLGVTLDHRLVDGAQLEPAVRILSQVVEDPEGMLGPPAG